MAAFAILSMGGIPFGFLVAAFDSAPRSSSTAPQPAEGESGQISPVDLARITEVTLGKVGTYYISVESKEENGANRGYHIAVTLENTGQVSADHGDAPFDTETEPNDTRQQADVLRPDVAMAGVFDRTLIGPYTEVITPAVTDIGYFYVGCNESDPTTLPSGNTDCQCDMSQVSPGGNAYVEPGNLNITNPLPADCEADVDSANPDNACKRETACEARVVTTTPEQTQYVGRFHYDTEVFVYRSDGDEQVRIQICTRTQCEFDRVHLKVHQGNVLLMEGPIQPGQVIDLGVAFPGDYYFILSPEPNGVDPETGDPILDDLFGPYDILLMSTRLRPSGPTPEPKPVQKPEKKNPPKQDDKEEQPPEQQEKSWLEMFLGG
ncbi:MAG TPA: hypothetical protein EYP90_08530 [Chromatiaceae bacterium]|nr:hypothetical protein [Chromatiaceae bacterium]